MGGDRENTIVLTVMGPGYDLDSGQGVLACKINGALLVAKVACLKGFGSPASEAPKVQLRAKMLQQNSHKL